MFPVANFEFDQFQVGQINNYDPSHNLNKIYKRFVEHLQKVLAEVKIAKIDEKKKNHFSPSWVAEAAQIALEIMEKSTPDSVAPFDPKVQVMSKGGTLDVGTHIGTTRPDTAYMVVWAFMDFVC